MKQKDKCYLVCSVKDDLPVACFDTIREVMEYLDVSYTMVWRSYRHGAIIRGLYVEQVLLG